mgnify:CR=1 FL=1
MDWNEVTRIETKGSILTVKDAMIMLSEDEKSPDWPYIECSPGEYIFEINVPAPFFAHRARIRKVDSEPALGKELGAIDVDHAFFGVIDYEVFRDAVSKDYEEYGDWTAMELDDELAINFSGEIQFDDTKLLYVKSGDGDGTYMCYELVENGKQVGIECVFIP